MSRWPVWRNKIGTYLSGIWTEPFKYGSAIYWVGILEDVVFLNSLYAQFLATKCTESDTVFTASRVCYQFRVLLRRL
jgi:hypothetical protein